MRSEICVDLVDADLAGIIVKMKNVRDASLRNLKLKTGNRGLKICGNKLTMGLLARALATDIGIRDRETEMLNAQLQAINDIVGD